MPSRHEENIVEAKSPNYQYLNDKDTKELMKHYSSRQLGWCQVGEDKWFLPMAYARHGEGIFQAKVRSTDRWIVTFPRSGTIWAEELVWLINNDLNYEEATKNPIGEKYYFLDFEMMNQSLDESSEILANEKKIKLTQNVPQIAETLDSMTSPRFIMTHLPFDVLPPGLLDAGCKVIYVARNPKDVVVSYYHLKRSRNGIKYSGDFASFWNFFQRDLKLWCPYWSHVKKAWSLRHHPNLLFVFYEEMKMDLPAVIRRAADFYGRPCTDAEVDKLAKHLDIESFRKNPTIVARTLNGNESVSKERFVRNGQVGGWKELFTPELEAQADKWIEENLRDTDLRFPGIDIPALARQ